MSDKTTLQSHNTKISTNNTNLNSILQTINNLPEASTSEDLSSELTTQTNLLSTQTTKLNSVKQLLQNKAVDGDDNFLAFVTNTLEVLDNDEITELPSYSCAYRTTLKTINLPNCTTIGDRTFIKCSGVTFISLPSLTALAAYAFANMTSLTLIEFPNKIRISTNTFNGCSSLSTVILRHTKVCTLSGTNAFTGTPIADGTGYVYVPDELLDSYKTATNWSTYSSQILPISGFNIGGGAN